MCLTSNIELKIKKHKVLCVNCLDKKPKKVMSPKVVIDEFPDLKIPSEEERRKMTEDNVERLYEKFKNSLIVGVPE